MMKIKVILANFESMLLRTIILLIFSGLGFNISAQIQIPLDKGSDFPVIATNSQDGKIYTVSVVDATPLKEKYEVCIYNGAYWHCLPLFEFNGVFPTMNEEPRFVATSVVEFKGNIYLGGRFEGGRVITNSPTLYRFNGTDWVTLSGDIDTRDKGINKMIVWQDTLIAAGSFSKAGGTSVSNIAKFDGNSWDFMGLNETNEGANGEIYDLELINNTVYIAGNFTRVAGQVSNAISRWKVGEGWSGIGKPFSGNEVYNLEKLGNDIVAVGQTITGDSTIRIFRGGLWQLLSSQIPTLTNANNIPKPVVIGNSLFLYGPFVNLSDSVDLIAWNGSSTWSFSDIDLPKNPNFQAAGTANICFGDFEYENNRVAYKNLVKLTFDKILVSGSVFGDLNSNCLLDGVEKGVFANVKVINKDFNDQFHQVQTNKNGFYSIELDKNNAYELEAQYLKDNYNYGCSKTTIAASSQATHYRNIDLGLDFSRNQKDLKLHSASTFGKISPNNMESALYFYASNAGNLTINGNSIHLEFDSSLSIKKIVPTPADLKPGKITWTIDQLAPGETFIYKIYLNPVNKALGTALNFNLRSGSGSFNEDVDKIDNFDTLNTSVANQDKNNFKTVSKSGIFTSIDELRYGIYFTNTTGRVANSVTIIDTLDTDLPKRVTYTNYSHANKRSLIQDNILYITFTNINLIRSEDGMADASGLFEYKFVMKDVKQKFVDQEFTNTATIHFDYIDFRRTNTVSSILSRFSSVDNLSLQRNYNLFPNPTDDKLFLSSDKGTVITVTDILGKTVTSITVDAKSTATLDVSTWQNGIYLFSDGQSTQKIIIQH